MNAIASQADLVEFIRSYRGPIDLRSAALDLENLGRFGAGWPRRSRAEWQRELSDLVAAGQLRRTEGMIDVPPPKPIEPDLQQGWLFP